ncbi:hypothetical protein F2P81_013687 [Scophthalmus maximus]|uniref:Uncharacterized protein n=1 Tax=Scophthalmus maximus TaxID=52904 RepID=A0A6A4SRI0_SCOMX|nr:hypothetical protein F2P81_013687 [Scophthalmus maximus]
MSVPAETHFITTVKQDGMSLMLLKDIFDSNFVAFGNSSNLDSDNEFDGSRTLSYQDSFSDPFVENQKSSCILSVVMHSRLTAHCLRCQLSLGCRIAKTHIYRAEVKDTVVGIQRVEQRETSNTHRPYGNLPAKITTNATTAAQVVKSFTIVIFRQQVDAIVALSKGALKRRQRFLKPKDVRRGNMSKRQTRLTRQACHGSDLTFMWTGIGRNSTNGSGKCRAFAKRRSGREAIATIIHKHNSVTRTVMSDTAYTDLTDRNEYDSRLLTPARHFSKDLKSAPKSSSSHPRLCSSND